MSSSYTILCIDDDSQNLALMRQLLEDDYQLRFALGGARGLQAVQKNPPDMILLDVNMPDIDGFEVARNIKSEVRFVNVPIIFVTSSSDDIDEQTGFDVGGVDYIHKPISGPLLKARIRTHLSLTNVSALERSQRSAIHMLGIAGHYKDTDTGVHIWRMAAYSRHLARLAGWNVDRAARLEIAAPLHDTGKIGITDAILKKPGPLTDDEWAIMKTHSQIGYDILSQSQDAIFKLAAEIALNHHEKWDGTGYPNGYAGDAIPESARIVAVADVFDALSMRRPYKQAWPIHKVVQTIKEMTPNHLEERLVILFLKHLPDFLDIRTHWEKQEQQQIGHRTIVGLQTGQHFA
ncbi:MAG: response regulator [Reinekea sp.]